MQGSDDRTILSFRNAFTRPFLDHLGEAGPWEVEEIPDERLIDALHVVEMIVRSPELLADLLEAAGPLALERAGAILASRLPVA